MNRLIFNKDIELIEFCAKKCDEIEQKYFFQYVFAFTASGKQWRYYMAIRRRILLDLKLKTGC